jgi:hypothetical protein
MPTVFQFFPLFNFNSFMKCKQGKCEGKRQKVKGEFEKGRVGRQKMFKVHALACYPPRFAGGNKLNFEL